MPIDKDLWDCFVNIEEKKEEATKRANSLCSDFLGEAWNCREFKVEKISGGMTNLVFKCSIPEGVSHPHMALLRVQCDKDVMQLQNELIIFMKLAEHGLGPKLLGVFPGGRLEEFILSRTLTYEETRDPKYSSLVAQTMAKIHQVRAPLSVNSQMIPTMRQWVDRIQKNGGDKYELWSKNAGVPKEKFPATINLESMRQEIGRIERYLENNQSPCRLTHNDLYATNILLKDNCPEGENPIVIIDFEFGMYNYRGFDIGNHLNELGMTYFEGMPTYSMDLIRLTDKSLHKTYCESYLQQTYDHIQKKKLLFETECLSGQMDKDIARLEQEAGAFQAIANYWWGLWNIVCDQEGIVGMDFFNAFRDRIALYYHLKNF